MRIEPLHPTPQPPPHRDVSPEPAQPAVTAGRTDLIVLSAAAYRALISAPRSAANLAGTFEVNVAHANGRLRVAPGSMDGVVYVEIYLFHVPTWPEPPGPIRQLHLTAQLRSSWVVRMAGDDAPGAQAQQLADAVTKLAQIPGQRTITIDAIPEEQAAAA